MSIDRKGVVILAMLVLLTGCASGDSASESTTTSTETTESQNEDPYEVFLTNGGGDAWEAQHDGELISREDAQARALLGCEADYAPGTIDYFLQEAYVHFCEQFTE